MGLRQANIWKSHGLKTVAGLFKAPERVHQFVQIAETGIISKIGLPMATGWATDVANRLSWKVNHRRQFRMEGSDEPILLITERSYEPLDPLKRDQDGTDSVRNLNEIAWSKRREAWSRVTEENKTGPGQRLVTTIIVSFVIIALVVILVLLVRHKG